jgi:tetratricopeptide (TPR) repeat protein
LPNLTNAARGYSIAFDALITSGERPQNVEAISHLLPDIQNRLLSEPGNEDAVRALGRLHLASGDVRAARQLYEDAAQRFPGANWYWVGLSRIEIDRKGDLENAEKWLTKAISGRVVKKPPIWVVVEARDAHFLRATLRERRGDIEGARSDLESALALSHNWLPAKSMLQILPPSRKP